MKVSMAEYPGLQDILLHHPYCQNILARVTTSLQVITDTLPRTDLLTYKSMFSGALVYLVQGNQNKITTPRMQKVIVQTSRT